jgi:LPXTG-motif cell wall-anchored protein
MYDNPYAPGAAGGVLAMTGTNSVWLALAAFALIAAGAALMRVVPKRG